MLNTNKRVVAFLLIAFGLAWTLWEIPLQLGLSAGNPCFNWPSCQAPRDATRRNTWN